MPVTTSTRTPVTKIYHEPTDAITCLASAAVVGGKFVKVGGAGSLGNHPAVLHAVAAGDLVYGVAHHDSAIGTDVSVLREGIVGVYAGEILATGDLVCAGAAGVAMKVVNIATTPPVPGRAYGVVTADTAIGVLAPVALYL